ncbi:MAG: endonuclease III [Ignavibacteria bacterium GWA2_55_11]|nr:MAG: endonuclease III [Ignavibacteria bacterium GWA2_55_11]OGU46056.1 MAG: endonuclease III [Ignavibacteria bacterium GWC2_56_12]OGU62129.1 MAG: endonuclease III [Ignavibacteria bacterium RIFCSPHIGHO2_02_FULL_56_12]OGU70617.1 MAG: endonuclease III [Ignavibacteria bacterium RIFCSPLOWO2_02_FULL_55_14]OGU73372.1 MAG: endonuclease III [Ignavibacteria bacterium RIFCSPLOWO2_12_FULL_56_21]
MKQKTESPTDVKKRASGIVRRLRKAYAAPKTALVFEEPFQLLIATILSAQCTDVRVNKVTPGLFAKYPSPGHFATARAEELEQDIRSTGFFRNKTKNIIGCSKAIMERHGGKVPERFDDLVELPGVGRKTANCVMGGAFGVNSGVVVDTHVQRLAGRLGLSKEENAEKIEQDLMKIVPQKDWYDFSNLLILHGREVCDARKPLCGECTLLEVCPSGPGFMKGMKPAKKKR